MASIDYEDTRFSDVENAKQSALEQSNGVYDQLIENSKSYYDNLINQNKDWADKQAEIQNQQTDLAIKRIEDEKDKANRDYTKEQKGAYQDFMKQSNAYGSNMQAVGENGLSGSGWSETIQAGYYNTWQNRVAQARESFNDIIKNFDNNITEAQLQNNSLIAQIYSQAEKEQLELALQSYTLIKDLTLSKQNTALSIDSEYNNRWRQVEDQINKENSLAEEIRQYNESMAENKRQFDEQMTLKKRKQELEERYRQQQLELQRKAAEAENQRILLSQNNETLKTENIKTNNLDSTLLRQYIVAAGSNMMENVYDAVYNANAKYGDKQADNLAREEQRHQLESLYDNNKISEAEFRQIAKEHGL